MRETEKRWRYYRHPNQRMTGDEAAELREQLEALERAERQGS